MKKNVSVRISLMILFFLFSISNLGTAGAYAGEKDSMQIITTIFPEYDWVQNILGDNPAGAEVTLLLDNGVDLHSFQPSAADILKISGCDLFIYVGGESDQWVEDVLRDAVNKDMQVLNLLEILGNMAKEEELVEGMEGDAGAEPEYDEHVWLSLKNASVLTGEIAASLGRMDPDHADLYSSNAAAYAEKLNALDEAYQTAVSDSPIKTLLFGDRFPFRYLADDYGLSYYAAFSGCSAETEASFETITFLAQKMDELSLHSIITIDGTDQRIAETIIQSTSSKDQQILIMDSMQSGTAADIENGMSYLSIMEKNLEILKEALR